MPDLALERGNSEPDGTGYDYVQFAQSVREESADGELHYDLSGAVFDDGSDVVYGQIRFMDGADRQSISALLRKMADFFEADHFPKRA